MFHSNELKIFNIIDHGKKLGIIYYNPSFDFKQETVRPFIRCKLRIVESIGRVNYQILDEFITISLNDYYNKLLSTTDNEIRKKNTIEYQQLYFLWQKIAQAKQNRNINLNSYYDDLVYRLYILGYRN